MSGGTGVFGSIGYAQREAIFMQERREAFAIFARACDMDNEGVGRALAEVDRRARETMLTWHAASRQVEREIAKGEVTW